MTQWNWYPCVRFTVNGGETEWIATGGSREGAWRIGQRVQVLYDLSLIHISDGKQVVVVDGCVDETGRDAAAGGAARLRGFELFAARDAAADLLEIGRASCRERV